MGQIKTLEVLELQYSKVDAAALEVLKALPKLRRLQVSIDGNSPEQFFREIGSFKDAVLLLHNVESPHGVFANLSLKNLALLDNKGLALFNVKITRPHVEVLKKMKHLKMLELLTTGVTDDLLVEIAKIPLTELVLVNEPVTDRGIQVLTKVKTLKNILVQECPRVSSLGVAQLQKAMPNTRIDTIWKSALGEPR